MKITDEVNYIGLGHKQRYNDIRQGYWTPELASWSDESGFINGRDLSTGNLANPCPILCITRRYTGKEPLNVKITGYEAIVDTGAEISYQKSGLTGFEKDTQYNQAVYRRRYLTGSETFKHQFTIPAHTKPGKIFEIPTKMVYDITNIKCSHRNRGQPLTRLSFIGLADNGSKLLYSMNWNDTFDNLVDMKYGMFGHPNSCPRCGGDGVTGAGGICSQCGGYGYNGPNANGYLLDKLGKQVGVTQSSGESVDTFANKIWAMNWHIVPTQNEIKRYMAHFARIDTGSTDLNVRNIFPKGTSTGTHSIVDIQLPFTIPASKIDRNDKFWSTMAQRCAPAGVNVRFSFLVKTLTGNITLEEKTSIYTSGYVNGELTGEKFDQQYGFFQPFDWVNAQAGTSWYELWGGDWMFYNGTSGGYDRSGYMCSGDGTFKSGFMTGNTSEWIRWSAVEENLTNGEAWHTGDTSFVNQGFLQTGGTFYHDNFWASGLEGVQY